MALNSDDSGIRTYAEDECLRCGCTGDAVETVRHGTRSMQLCGRCFRRMRTMVNEVTE